MEEQKFNNVPLSLDEAALNERAEQLKRLYPDARSAVMPVLYLAQEHFGSVTDEAVDWVSSRVGIAPVHVREVATFYTMYYKKPVGRYHFQVCRTLSCAVRGAKKITGCLAKELSLRPGEVSKDGMWSYEEVECLGSCGTAPMCEINDTFFENLNEDKIVELIKMIGETKPDLRYSTLADELKSGQ